MTNSEFTGYYEKFVVHLHNCMFIGKFGLVETVVKAIITEYNKHVNLIPINCIEKITYNM